MIILRDEILLVFIDLQERLVPALEESDAVVARARLLIEAAGILGIPVIATEQYPKGLGPTVKGLGWSPRLPVPCAKFEFSAASNPMIVEAVKATGRRTLILAGAEAHICVLQSAFGFRKLGYEVAVVADAVGSRRRSSKEAALARMSGSGIVVVDSEMVIFECLGRAGTDEFRAISKLVR